MANYRPEWDLNGMDQEKLEGYLYQLNEQLRYMFDNLTPEDNYSRDAYNKYIEDEKRMAQMQFNIDGLKVDLKDFEKETVARFEVTDEKIELKVSKGQVSAEISVESGLVEIKGNRLVVESTNFKLDKSGNAKFSGDVEGASITASIIDVGSIFIDEDGAWLGDFYISADGTGMIISEDGCIEIIEGYGTGTDYKYGTIHVSGSDSETLIEQGEIECEEIYINQSWWDGWGITETLEQVYDRLEELESRSMR